MQLWKSGSEQDFEVSCRQATPNVVSATSKDLLRCSPIRQLSQARPQLLRQVMHRLIRFRLVDQKHICIYYWVAYHNAIAVWLACMIASALTATRMLCAQYSMVNADCCRHGSFALGSWASQAHESQTHCTRSHYFERRCHDQWYVVHT